MRHILPIIMLLTLPLTAEILKNTSFEDVKDDTFVSWSRNNFRTGGSLTIGTFGGHTGDKFAICHSNSDQEREAWAQRQPLPQNCVAVLVSAWYRCTPEVKAANNTGPCLRVHWFDAYKKEILLEQKFFPVVDDWTHVHSLLFIAPPDAVQVELQLHHWLTPGETHWDDASLTPISHETIAQNRELIAPLVGIDREPVFGQNLPYSPANDEVVTMNPPPFRWLPAARAASYTLQICQTPDFNDESLMEVTNYPWLVHVPTSPLVNGKWYWRYGADIANIGVIWSRTRAFTVTQDAHVWPFPRPEQIKISLARPRLFVKPKGLNLIRKRARSGDLKQMAENLLKNVKAFAGEELVKEPDWLPKSGQARSQAYTEIFRATRPPMDKMQNAALAYLLTADDDAGAEAKRRVLHFFSWDPNGPTNTFHNDEPAMWIMMRGCRAYDWTYELYSPAEHRQIQAAMAERARAIYKLLRKKPFDNNPYESHLGRQIGFLGEAAIELYNEVPEAHEWLQYILSIYWGVYPAWGREDGGWNEGPSYWSAYMDFALHFVVALREATGIDLSEKPFFHNTPYYSFYQCPPGSTISPFGDGNQTSRCTQPALMYYFSSLLKDPCLRWYAETYNYRPGGILGVALTDPSIKSQPPDSLPTARCFPYVGLVLSHTDLVDHENDIALSFRSSPYGAVSHGHNDQNCFTLEAFGEPLAIPTGHYNYYGSPHHDQWTRATKAKCGITYDGGQGEKRGWQAIGKITRFFHDDHFDSFAGDATAAYGGALDTALREIVHVKPGLIIIRDTLKTKQPKVFEFNLHAFDQMEINGNTVFTKRPKATLRTDFLLPKDVRFSQTDQFDPPPVWPKDKEFANCWHLRAATKPSYETTFLTVLQPHRNSDFTPRPSVKLLESATAQGVEAIYNDGSKAIVLFARQNIKGNATLGNISFNGSVHAVLLDKQGKITASYTE